MSGRAVVFDTLNQNEIARRFLEMHGQSPAARLHGYAGDITPKACAAPGPLIGLKPIFQETSFRSAYSRKVSHPEITRRVLPWRASTEGLRRFR